MGFRTKLDFSNNRQIKQFPQTLTVLSGGTSFGVPFSKLPNGPNLLYSGLTNIITNVITTFSGNSTNTVYNWVYPDMQLAINTLSAITPTTSAFTQNASGYTGTSSTIIDDNLVNLSYSGVTFDLSPISMYNLGGGNYSGSVRTNFLQYFSAHSLDYSGRTIWVDVSGITRTNGIIISKDAVIGNIFVCDDTEGRGRWVAPSSVISSTCLWSASTGFRSAVLKYKNSIGSGDYSVSEGQYCIASGYSSHAEGTYTHASDYSHAEGNATLAIGRSSHSEGESTIASGDYSHAQGLYSIASGFGSHAEGNATIASGIWSHAEGAQCNALGNFSHAGGSGSTTNTDYSFAHGLGCVTGGLYSNAQGYFCVASGVSSNSVGFLNFISGNYSHASGYNNQINGDVCFIHGINSSASGICINVLGSNIIGNVNNTTYVDRLNIKTVGSSAFANDIRIDANGNLTTNTSDKRLKENIKPLKNSLDIIKKLNGVSFQWKDRNAGTDAIKLGFIAQEVEKVDDRLTFTNKNDGYMGIHTNEIIPLLVESVKELSNDLIPNKITIPNFTPKNSNDTNGNVGNLVYDEKYLYIKTNSGWKRTNLENF